MYTSTFSIEIWDKRMYTGTFTSEGGNVIAFALILEGRWGGPLLTLSTSKEVVVNEALRVILDPKDTNSEEAGLVIAALRKRIQEWDGEKDLYKQGFSCLLSDGYELVRTGSVTLRKVEYT